MVDIIFIRQKEPLGLGHAILTAKPAVGNGPFAVLLGDEIMVSEVPALKQLIDTFKKFHCSVLGVQEVSDEEVSKYGIVEGREVESGVLKVESVVEKPQPEEVSSRLAIVGRYILTPKIFELLEKTPPGKGGEIQLTDAIGELLMKEAVYAKTIEAIRYDTGSKIGFLKATVDIALGNEELKEEFLSFLKERVKENALK